MKRGFHFMRRLTDKNDRGEHVVLVRIGAGYWPCLRAPFVQLGLGRHLFDVWFGDPSYDKLANLAKRSPGGGPRRRDERVPSASVSYDKPCERCGVALIGGWLQKHDRRTHTDERCSWVRTLNGVT